MKSRIIIKSYIFLLEKTKLQTHALFTITKKLIRFGLAASWMEKMTNNKQEVEWNEKEAVFKRLCVWHIRSNQVKPP